MNHSTDQPTKQKTTKQAIQQLVQLSVNQISWLLGTLWLVRSANVAGLILRPLALT